MKLLDGSRYFCRHMSSGGFQRSSVLVLQKHPLPTILRILGNYGKGQLWHMRIAIIIGTIMPGAIPLTYLLEDRIIFYRNLVIPKI